MAVYAVGDIQGCYTPLKKLLDRVEFDSSVDQLWCVGDLVNRGPDSLKTLRFLKSLGDACVCVLGNHDVHLLALAAGGKTYPKDTLDDIFKANDTDELIEWLRFRPVLHHDEKLNWCMVHAGLHPDWSLKQAKKRALKIERRLQGGNWKKFCEVFSSRNFPIQDTVHKGLTRKVFSLAVMTRTRYCSQSGLFDWQNKCEQPSSAHYKAWYKHAHLRWKKDTRVLFGHWAAKGLVTNEKHVLGLDSGCVWGGVMTLARLDLAEIEFISEPCEACHSI